MFIEFIGDSVCEEEDLDQCLGFLLVLFLAELFLASWLSCVFIMKRVNLGDSGDEGHVDSGAGLLQLNWCSYETDIIA